MPLPGFTAEASLYKTSAHYGLMEAFVQADSVIPQQIINWGSRVGHAF
jgi:hypothetical protein